MSARHEIWHRPPGRSKPMKTILGWRALECLEFLMTRKSATRLEMLQHNSPRLALNAPSSISTLIKKGFSIVKTKERGLDASGQPTWWLRYALRGQVSRITPVGSKPRQGGHP